MRSAIAILLLPFAAALSGCDGTEAGSATPSAAPTRSTPTKPGPVDATSARPRDVPGAAPGDDAPAGPVSALAGRFEPVPLPRGTAPIVDVAGRSERDVWMLAEDGAVVHWDGARAVAKGAARCFAIGYRGSLFDCSSRPAMCARPAASRCAQGNEKCVWSVNASWLRPTSDGVAAGALVWDGDMHHTLVEARLDPSGHWSCKQSKELVQLDGAERQDGLQALALSVDGAQVRFGLQGWNGPTLLLVDGRRVALPVDGNDLGFDARGPGDLWLWASSRLSRGRRGDGGTLSVLVATPENTSPHGRLWHGNGMTWTPMRTGLAALTDVWFSEPDTTWLLGPAETRGGSERLIRRDLDWNVRQRFDTPGATAVLRGEKDFWLLGATTLYAWDGEALHRAEAPLAIHRGWRSPAGEVWLVGSGRASGATGSGDAARDGAVFRLPAPERRKP